MDPVVRPQLARIAAKAGLDLERFPEGTVRLSLPNAGRPIDVTADWFRRHARSPVYCVGREKEPPLASSKDKSAKSRFPVLALSRVVLMAADEVAKLLKALLSAGGCVDNDAYLFPKAGGWLAYVGHHNELFVYLAAKVRSGGSSPNAAAGDWASARRMGTTLPET